MDRLVTRAVPKAHSSRQLQSNSQNAVRVLAQLQDTVRVLGTCKRHALSTCHGVLIQRNGVKHNHSTCAALCITCAAQCITCAALCITPGAVVSTSKDRPLDGADTVAARRGLHRAQTQQSLAAYGSKYTVYLCCPYTLSSCLIHSVHG